VVVLWRDAHLSRHVSLGSAPHDATRDRAQQPQQTPDACPWPTQAQVRDNGGLHVEVAVAVAGLGSCFAGFVTSEV
jgi:hypothetical protein